jgi:predicted thioesterase
MRILLATIQSHRCIPGDIERGIALFQKGDISVCEKRLKDGKIEYVATIPIKGGETRKTSVRFTRDMRDIEYNHCYCTRRYKNHPLCRHSVAAILTIQGGVVDTPLTIGRTATATVVTNKSNTAKAVGSGSLDVFATPSMIALMEEAACSCINDGLEDGQTSVGTQINAEHIAASSIGTIITAEAKIEKVFGRTVEFSIEAYGASKKIGTGTHTRAIVDKKKFMSRL